MQAPIPICIDCKHFHGQNFTCDAFPDGIPEIVRSGQNDHHEPLPEQKNEIVFEKLPE